MTEPLILIGVLKIIPCIGYSNVNTQDILHPLTTVEVGDIDNKTYIEN